MSENIKAAERANDVEKAAQTAAEDCMVATLGPHPYEDIEEIIYGAIMAERERCIHIALSSGPFESSLRLFGQEINAHYGTQRKLASSIALQIMQGAKR